jgi:hypothetical protein
METSHSSETSENFYQAKRGHPTIVSITALSTLNLVAVLFGNRLPGLLFYIEDGGRSFLRNVGELVPDYTASQEKALFIASSAETS